MKTFYIALTWSVSKGCDTYGYNICRLDVPGYAVQVPPTPTPTPTHNWIKPKRYRCSGGGYDMIGTVVGDWLQDRYQDRLLKLAQAPSRIATFLYRDEVGDLQRLKESADRKNVLYATTFYPANRKKETYVSLDGACGIESIRIVAEAIGVKLNSTTNRKGHTDGFIVTDYGSLDALRASGEYVSHSNRVQA